MLDLKTLKVGDVIKNTSYHSDREYRVIFIDCEQELVYARNVQTSRSVICANVLSHWAVVPRLQDAWVVATAYFLDIYKSEEKAKRAVESYKTQGMTSTIQKITISLP